MPQQFEHNSYDAIIIGARCAGAATAMLMARNGASVLSADREKAFWHIKLRSSFEEKEND